MIKMNNKQMSVISHDGRKYRDEATIDALNYNYKDIILIITVISSNIISIIFNYLSGNIYKICNILSFVFGLFSYLLEIYVIVIAVKKMRNLYLISKHPCYRLIYIKK